MDCPRSIARDMIRDVGRLDALLYLAVRMFGATSWREARQIAALGWAVARA